MRSQVLRTATLRAGAALILIAGFVGVAAAPALAAPPANDNFANAQTHTGDFSDSQSNAEATTETGEPSNSGCGETDRTVWYALTPAASGTVEVDVSGSAAAVVVNVFTGPNLTSLTDVNCRDTLNTTGRFDFEATASTTYWIQLGGYVARASGTMSIVVDAPEPPNPDVAVSVSDSADPVSLGGANITYTVSVSNSLNPATGVSVATTLSGASSSIVSYSTSQGSCSVSAPTVTCSLGNLAVSGAATITVTVTPAATGTVTATAVATETETDANSADNTDAESTTVNNALGCAILGTNGDNTLNGTNGDDVICGLGGNDTINGGNGNDIIYAGAGNDVVDGGNGDDILYGGDGDDAMGGGNGADYLHGEAGNDTNYGETLLGSLLYLFDNGNDHIYGGPGNDDLDGQNGNDVLLDHDGTDIMSGGLGNDNIDLQDGIGGDTGNGGLGTDTCTVDGGDTTSGC